MADSISRRFNLQTELIKGSNGVFEVHLDGNLIFSKAQIGRFPEDDEIENILDGRLES